MIYEELPDTIKAVVPKEKVAKINKVNANLISLQITYNSAWDRWQLKNGRWEYVQPNTILK